MDNNKIAQEQAKRLRLINLDHLIKDFEVEQVPTFDSITNQYIKLEHNLYDAVIEECLNMKLYPFYIIKSQILGGDILNILYISSYEDEWEYEVDDLKEKFPYAFVKVLSGSGVNELGIIGISFANGGLIRVA